MYEDLWTAPPRDALAELDKSFSPRAPQQLYETVGSPPITADSKVIDLGCGLGIHSLALARRFGCRVSGVDLCEGNLRVANESLLESGLQALVRFHLGDIQSLPFSDAEFDIAWCRDVLIHVPDLSVAFAQCARVLVPGGTMIVYSTFATRLFSAVDREIVCAALNIFGSNIDEGYFEKCFKDAGFVTAQKTVLGGEWIEYNEETRGDGAKYLRHLTRMLRAREAFTQKLGTRTFGHYLALNYWQLFMLMGKLSANAYQLVKA